MMKRLLNIAALFLFPMVVFAQTYFSERHFFETYNSWDGADQILETDTSYIIVGGTGDQNNFYWNRLGFMVLDKYGNMISSKSLGDTIYEYHIQYHGAFKKSSNDTYIGVGARRKYTAGGVHDAGMVYKFDHNLDTLWTNSSVIDKVAPIDTSYFFNHFCEMEDGCLAIIGGIIISGEKGIAILLKTDSLGNELWRQYFPRWPHSIGINVIQTPDGGFALSVYNWQFQSVIADNYLFKTDSLGNEQWKRKIGGPYGDEFMFLVNSPDNTIICAYRFSDSITEGPYPSSYTRESLVKYDLNGNLLWDRKYGEYEYEGDKWLTSVNINDSGEIIVSEYTYRPFPHRVGCLFNFSNDGDSLWYREYEYLNELFSENTLYGVTPTNDGGYIAVGNVYPSLPDTGNQDVWVLKVDSLGCEEWNYCWVGEEEHIVLRETGKLKIYPNPANYVVSIYVPKENESETYQLLIYDLYGLKMKEVEIPPGKTNLRINVANWPSGLYTAVSTYKGEVLFRGKFVVQ